MACSDPRSPALPLFPQEIPAIQNARPARSREFAAGRSAARAAMRAIGMASQPVLMGPDRAPVWPKNMVGSISHDQSLCVAMIGRSPDFCAMAADLEPDEDLPQDILSEICTRAELNWLTQQPADRRGRLARQIFSAKECAYKCQYGLTGDMLEFHDFEVLLLPDRGRFLAEFQRPAGQIRIGTRLHGHCLIVSGHILTLMTLTAADSDAAFGKIEAREWT